MAILVLVLWLFTAGAGFSVLISSNLKGDRPVDPAELAPAIAPAAAPAAAPSAQASPGPQTGPASPSASPPASKRTAKRARLAQFDPPSLVAARNAPVLPGARSLLEFAHPACGIIGLAFWLGFSLVHARFLGWIGFGLAAVTACAGLTWFAINIRAARRAAQHAPSQHAPSQAAPSQHAPSQDPPPPPSFHGRLVALHGAAAALTLVLAALTGLILHG